MNKINLEIVTLDGVVYKQEAVSVTLPTESGVVGIFANHTPLVSIIKPGEIVVKEEGGTVHFKTSEGVLEVRPKSEVIIVVDKTEKIN
jgi:F-type H+-transporting ATPase subunit epsilon